MSFNSELSYHNTLGSQGTVAEVFQPTSMEHLFQQLPEFSKRYKTFSVFSTGHNWGYGCGSPNQSGGLLLKLNLCKKIKNFSDEHGIVTVEPGVTYGDLSEFLKSQGERWLTPVHGGGPNCSVLGNALERGYGLTPHSDHFGAVMSLKAIMHNGQIFEGSLSKIGAPHLDRLFRNGIGPYYDGLFTQSGLGIVTEITIRLAKKPAFIEMFHFSIHNADDFQNVVLAIKKSKQQLGSNLGGVNLMNRERLLSMMTEFPLENIETMQPLSESTINHLAKNFKLTPWTVVGTMYGPKNVVAATKKNLLANFSEIKCRKIFYNTNNRKWFLVLKKLLMKWNFADLANSINTVDMAFDVLNGKPNNVALKLAYWKNTNRAFKTRSTLNPTEDNCGLIWYAPLVEMTPDSVQKYIEFLKSASRKFNFNNLITLTTVDDLCFDSTVPILFDQTNKLDQKRAHDFYYYLLQEGLKQGFFPYRLNIESQRNYDFQTELFGLDLANPGRYR